jgi:hypothetical protein
MRRFTMTLAAAALVAAPFSMAEAASLRGSAAAMQQQNRVAVEHGLDFYRTADEIRAAVASGDLVKIEGNLDYAVADFVSFPYVRPELKLFVERLSAQYRDACGEQLVVTSATRPSGNQPRNAHALSVHPAGMALDLRVSQSATCRSWLEAALLGMESHGLINGIREHHPPHYHVAIFPEQYAAFAKERMAEEEVERRAQMSKAMRALDALALLPAPPVAARVEAEPTGMSGLAMLRYVPPLGLLPMTLSTVARILRLA